MGSQEDRRQMLRLRREADAILIGASTLRAYRRPCLSDGGDEQPLNAVMSSGLQGISPRWPFFMEPRLRRVLLVGHKAAPARLRAFEKNSEILKLEKPTARNPFAIQLLRALKNLGVERLLVEGGGALMWELVRHELVDEFHVTVTPRLIGGTESPTLVDGAGFRPSEVKNLKLQQCRVAGDELYLVYRKTGKPG